MVRPLLPFLIALSLSLPLAGVAGWLPPGGRGASTVAPAPEGNAAVQSATVPLHLPLPDDLFRDTPLPGLWLNF